MAYALILISKYFKENKEEEWLKVGSYLSDLEIPYAVKGGDFAKLKFWKLLERQIGERDDGSARNGYWKITQKGYDFISGKAKIPKFINLYNQKFYGYAGELIDIKEALGNKFNYSELMGGV